MKDIFRRGDASLYIAKRDWCPNALIETIGAGIPVITTDASGGVAEMLSFTENCTICSGEKDENENLFQYSEEYNALSSDCFDSIFQSLEKVYSNRFRVTLPTQFNISYTAKRYLAFFEKVISCNLN